MAYGLVKDIGAIKVVEQNVNTNSIYAKAARGGWKIAWPMFEQGGYLGPVLICQGEEVHILTKEQASQMLITPQVQNNE